MIMKRILVVVLVSLWTAAMAQESETRKVGSFAGISVSQGIEVYLTRGDAENVRVVVTGTEPENVLTEVSGSYLKIHMKSGRYASGVDATVYVTYQELQKLHASSAGRIFSEGIMKTDELDVSASSAGQIEVTVDVNTLELSASTAGEVEVEGRTRDLVADAATAGEIDADELEADDVEVRASSAGTARVFARQRIAARATTGGVIRYRGNPDKQNNSSSTGGAIRRSN